MAAAASPILQLIRRVAEDPKVRDLPDGDLLERFQAQQDQAAFHTLLRRHGPMVLDVCRGVLGDSPDADDAFGGLTIRSFGSSVRFPLESATRQPTMAPGISRGFGGPVMPSQPVKTRLSSAMIVVIILVTVFAFLLSVAASVAIALSIVYWIRRVPSVPPKPADTQFERRPAQLP